MNAATLQTWKDRAAAWEGSDERIAVGADALLELLEACGRQPPGDLKEVCLVPAAELVKMVRAAKPEAPEAEVSTLPATKDESKKSTKDDPKKTNKDDDAKA